MEKFPLFAGDELFQLIPQRDPIVMIDTLWRADDESAETGLYIKEDNIFCRDGVLTEPGILEHAAQSAAAFSGLDNFRKGLPPSVGYIAEVKKFDYYTLPASGHTLRTILKVLGNIMGMLMIEVEVLDGEEKIASGRLKLFIKQDNI